MYAAPMQPARAPQRLRGERRNQVWSWDLIYDQTEQGRTLRILTLMDEFTKQALAIHVGYSIRAVDAITVLEAAIERYGAPQHVRSDNGPEFIAKASQDWLEKTDIKTLYIQPGSPWEQAFIESFHDKLRDECLNRELFPSLAEARINLEQWRVEYNQHRPHSALGHLIPNQFSAQQTPTGCDRANERLKNGTPWASLRARLWYATYLQSPLSGPVALLRRHRPVPGHSRNAPGPGRLG